MACFDDCTPILAPKDIVSHPELTRVHDKPLGLTLSCSKTKLMTIATGISVTLAPPTPRTAALCAAPAHIKHHAPLGTDVDPKITTAMWLVGQSIGSAEFTRQFLAQALQQCISNLDKLKHSGLEKTLMSSALCVLCPAQSHTPISI